MSRRRGREYGYGYGYGSRFPAYTSVAQRRAKAERKIAKLRKQGKDLHPVEISGRAIAKTFWGKSWCKNLESYSDYASRLPRGRSYVRHSAVINLRIADGGAGRVVAQVNGTSLYKVTLTIETLAPERWQAIRRACAGRIDSLLELLDGKLSSSVMEIVTRPGEGLFPAPAEIDLQCTCPDWADMCKHVAATLYGVGARLDESPELLFALRGVDPVDMFDEALEQGVRTDGPASSQRLEVDDLASVFGVDIEADDETPADEAGPKRARKGRKRAAAKKSTGRGKRRAAPRRAKPAPPPPEARPTLSPSALRLLDAVAEHPGLRSPALAKRLKLSRSSVARLVAELRRAGRVEFLGAPRTGGYFETD